MPLTGQAKIDYQREYMRSHRSNHRSNQWKQKNAELVRPKAESVRPSVTPDVRPVQLQTRPGDRVSHIEPQSYNPMMVGYVPPTGE